MLFLINVTFFIYLVLNCQTMTVGDIKSSIEINLLYLSSV